MSDQPKWFHGNKYNADLACIYCEGITRHALWCPTECEIVYYAMQAVICPAHLTIADHLNLHGMGVAWTGHVSVNDIIVCTPENITGDMLVMVDVEVVKDETGDV